MTKPVTAGHAQVQLNSLKSKAMVQNANNRRPRLVVGIGASAGGLEAIKRLLTNLRADNDLAYLLVLHLDPNHHSLISDILNRASHLTVREASHGELITANTVYVVKPGEYLEVDGSTIQTSPIDQLHGSRYAIDLMLRSIARDFGHRAVGVILTGAGSDGTAGSRAVKAAGGLTIVQDPKTAEYDSMPLSAVRSGVVDLVLSVDDIGQQLNDYAGHPLNDSPGPGLADAVITKIRDLLAQEENLDLSQYKENTVARRISRRVTLTGVATPEDYVTLIASSENERHLLLRDLMINVTNFFRDPEAFAELDHYVAEKLIANQQDGSNIRVWVAGCATGEEAYSVAVLLHEAIERAGKSISWQLFATDVDEESVKHARRGVYTEGSIAHMPQTYANQYFNDLGNGYCKVNTWLRDRISFATQNVYSDPPFSRLDLICCRNLLIYLKKDTQAQVLKSFYFALKPAGLLFLGNSESLGGHENFFRQLSQKWRIFQRDEIQAKPRALPARVNDTSSLEGRSTKTAPGKPQAPEGLGLNSRVANLLLRGLPPTAIVDGDDHVVYVHGNINEFIRFPEGEPRFDFVQMLAPSIRARVRNALFKVRRSDQKIEIHSSVNEAENGEETVLKITVWSIDDEVFGPGAVTISFESSLRHEGKSATGWKNISVSDQEKIIEVVEHELLDTREELQNTIEELETSTEDLRAANEEAFSTNEELQSANEELEASTEELRSLNEELTLVNDQLKEKVVDLEIVRNDLENFFASTNIATVMLDSEFKIKRCTPAAEKLLGIGVVDIDRPVTDIASELMDEQTLKEAREVFASLSPSRQEVRLTEREWFARAIMPYQTQDKRIDGVVITFANITEQKNALSSLKVRQRQQAVIADLGLKALVGDQFESLVDMAAREVSGVLSADISLVARHEREDEFTILSALDLKTGEDPIAKCTTCGDTLLEFALQGSHPIVIHDLASEQRFAPSTLFLQQGVGSGLVCVIYDGQRAYGVIALFKRETNGFSEEDALFLTAIANVISTSLHRRRSEKRLRVSEERLNLARKSAHIGIHDHDLVEDRIQVDEQVKAIWGIHDRGDIWSCDLFKSAFHPQDRQLLEALIDEVATPGSKKQEYREEYRIINRSDHRQCWVESTGQIFFDGDRAVRLVGSVRDITHRKKAELELFSSEEKLRIAKNSNKFGAFSYDIASEKLEWDQLLWDLWGVSDHDDLNLALFYKGLHPDDVATTQDRIAASLEPGSSGHYFAIYRVINMKTGCLSWVEASGQVIFEGSVPKRMIGMVIDITERKNLEESLQAAVAKLDAENKKKNEFIATLGHELRNPLAAINSGLQILELKQDDSPWAMEMMANNVHLICSLLDDLLDLTRITLGKIELKNSRLDLRQLLANMVRSFESIAKQNRQLLVPDLGQEPLWVYGDATRLEQVFSNILTNAFKFTPEGGRIEVIASTDSGHVEVRLRDNGVGIPEEKVRAIFDPFEQVAGKVNVNSGLGIGLSLVQQFVQMHGGHVEVYSAGENQGSTFTVALPLCASADQQTEQPEPELPELKKHLKVLVVDDNEDAARGLQAMLESFQCDVVSAHDGRSALAATAGFAPEVFILDIGLPDMDGYELCRQLRGSCGNQATYIALTGYGPSAQSKADGGFDAHLTKPANFKELLGFLGQVH